MKQKTLKTTFTEIEQRFRDWKKNERKKLVLVIYDEIKEISYNSLYESIVEDIAFRTGYSSSQIRGILENRR